MLHKFVHGNTRCSTTSGQIELRAPGIGIYRDDPSKDRLQGAKELESGSFDIYTVSQRPYAMRRVCLFRETPSDAQYQAKYTESRSSVSEVDLVAVIYDKI